MAEKMTNLLHALKERDLSDMSVYRFGKRKVALEERKALLAVWQAMAEMENAKAGDGKQEGAKRRDVAYKTLQNRANTLKRKVVSVETGIRFKDAKASDFRK